MRLICIIKDSLLLLLLLITPDEETGDTVKNGDADLRNNLSTVDDEATTKSIKTTVGRSTERGRITLWGQPFWGRSAGVALSATSFKLLGMCEFFLTVSVNGGY